MLVSAVEQSVIHIHISTLSQILFPYRSLQSTEQSCLCYTGGPYFIYSVVYMCIYVNPNLPIYPSTLPPLGGSHVCFLHLWHYFCFVSQFICTILIPHVSDIIWYLSSVWLTSLSTKQSLGPPMLLQMSLFCSFLCWVILHCIHDRIFPTHSSVAWFLLFYQSLFPAPNTCFGVCSVFKIDCSLVHHSFQSFLNMLH